MNKLDKQYTDLLQDILDNGVTKQDRTGTGTISVFGRQIRHDMKDGFPLLTTKKMPWKTIVTELLWFLRGDTNIKFLVDNNCHIWDGDAYKNYLKWFNEQSKSFKEQGIVRDPWTQEQYIEQIKLGNVDADLSDLGPIYGKQWRNWKTSDTKSLGGTFWGPTTEITENSIDQIQNLINDLKTNPDSRRLMVNAWNPGQLDEMVLPPCHYGFQVYTRELSLKERYELVRVNGLCPKYSFEIEDGKPVPNKLSESEWYDKHNIPTRAISLMWNQRSVDTFLGLPFNIASYGLLLEIIAKEVNMVPDELIGNLGDVHLYSNHIEQAKEQIGKKYTHEERTEMLKQAMGEEIYNKVIGELVPFGGGLSDYYDSYKLPYTTREPFPLPTLKFSEWYKNANEEKHSENVFNDWVESLKPEDFIIDNYQSHPTIKAPLSN